MTWIWVAATTLMTWSVFGISLLGATAFHSRRWEQEFAKAASQEEERRGLSDRKLSRNEHDAVDTMKGRKSPHPDNLAAPFHGLGLRAFAVLAGYSDPRELAMLVADRRRELLGRALERQAAQARRFTTVRWAVHAWVVQKRLSRTEVAVKGIVWLGRRSVNEVTAIVKEYSTKLGVIAVFVSSPYWLLTRDHAGALAAPDLIGLLTKLVLPGLVLWAIGVLLCRILVAHAGSPRTWPRRKVVGASLTACVCIAAGAGAQLVSSLVADQNWSVWSYADDHSHNNIRIGAAIASMTLLWMTIVAARSVLNWRLLTSERIAAVALSAVLLAISLLAIGVVFAGAVASLLRTVAISFFVLGCLVFSASWVFKAYECFGRYTSLARAGVEVPRGGFSRWLLGVWLLSVTAIVVCAGTPAATDNTAVGLALIVPAMVTALGTVPVMVVTVLFVRRVNTYFERHATAEAENNLSGQSSGEDQRLPNRRKASRNTGFGLASGNASRTSANACSTPTPERSVP